jgi:hypothetical protein
MATRFKAGRPRGGKDFSNMKDIRNLLEKTDRQVVTSTPIDLEKFEANLRERGKYEFTHKEEVTVPENVHCPDCSNREKHEHTVRKGAALRDRLRVLTEAEAREWWRFTVHHTFDYPTFEEMQKGASVGDVLRKIAGDGPPITWVLSEVRTSVGKLAFKLHPEKKVIANEVQAMQGHLSADVIAATQHLDQIDGEWLALCQDFTLCRNTKYETLKAYGVESQKIPVLLLQTFQNEEPLKHYMDKGDLTDNRIVPARINHWDQKLADCYRTRTFDEDRNPLYMDVAESERKGRPWWLVPAAALSLCAALATLAYYVPAMLAEHVDSWLSGGRLQRAASGSAKARGHSEPALSNSPPMQPPGKFPTQPIPQDVLAFFNRATTRAQEMRQTHQETLLGTVEGIDYIRDETGQILTRVNVFESAKIRASYNAYARDYMARRKQEAEDRLRGKAQAISERTANLKEALP